MVAKSSFLNITVSFDINLLEKLQIYIDDLPILYCKINVTHLSSMSISCR